MNNPYLNKTYLTIVFSMVLALFDTGCEVRHLETAPQTDNWLGKWNGPEGTFLELTGANGRYEVTIQNLDGPRIFQGVAVGKQIQFERDGILESIHATNGIETGMKWLSDKSNCLTVNFGEGYCRD